MKSILLLLAALTPCISQAQIKWLETGQKWRFCSMVGWVGGIGCDSLEVGDDAFIAGKMCKKVGSSFAYEQSDKVFFYDDGQFLKVYDFDMIEGETLNWGTNTYQVDSLIVADLGDFSGVRVQKCHFVNNPFRGISIFYIAEGIGIINADLQHWPMSCHCGHFFPGLLSCEFNIDGIDTYLMSFQSGDKTFFASDSLMCNFESSTKLPIMASDLKIEPNPATTACRLRSSISFLEGDFTLFDCAGIAVRHWNSVPKEFDLTGCPQGFYILTMRHNRSVLWSGKLIKQ